LHLHADDDDAALQLRRKYAPLNNFIAGELAGACSAADDDFHQEIFPRAHHLTAAP
jgi:hypothetical protein